MDIIWSNYLTRDETSSGRVSVFTALRDQLALVGRGRPAAGAPRGGVLMLDESPIKKAGTEAAGAARQWNGRIGHVDLSQVGTFLAYANGPVRTWVDG
jgi:hypothetical protein